LIIFSALGTIVGIVANHTFVSYSAILPLVYLGFVFYSSSVLGGRGMVSLPFEWSST